jgi:hypothetical protein
MSLGRRRDRATTEDLFISYSDLPRGPSHPFYTRLDKILRKHCFDPFCEEKGVFREYRSDDMGVTALGL